MIVYGTDANGIVKPLLLDANGNAIVSSAPPTTTGGKFHLDASGNLYTLVDPPTTTGGKIKVDASGRVDVISMLHDVYVKESVTPVYANGISNNSEVTVYTVPAGKIFYCNSICINVSNTAAATGNGRANLYNAVPAVLSAWIISAAAGGHSFQPIPFVPPLYLPEGYKITSQSSVANLFCTVTITGYVM